MITITDLAADGAQVAFEYDADLVAAFKSRFPTARWAPHAKCWGIPGKLAAARVRKWADEIETAARDAAKAAEKIRREAEFDGRLTEVDPVAALEARRGEIKSKRVRVSAAIVTYPFDYSEQSVAVAKKTGGRFDAAKKSWSWTARTVADVETIIGAVNRIFEIGTAQVEADRARKAAAAAAARAERTALEARRFCERAARAPAPGDTIRVRGEIVTVESLGKPFRGHDNLSSMGGPVGAEGEWVQYVYFRAATADEIAAFEARESVQNAAAQRRRERQAAIAAVAQSTDAPSISAVPDGETIWADETHAAIGYSRRIVLTPDGWLWHVTYDGSDGAAWGDYNLGYNTRGARLPATPDLVAAIRSDA